MPAPPRKNFDPPPALWALLAVVMALAGAALHGYIQDEGAYLYQSRLLTEGRVPYRDFFTTQGPGLLFFLAPLVTLGPGLITARLYCALAVLLAFFLMMMVVRTQGGATSRNLLGLLSIASPALWFECANPRTQCPCVLLVGLTLYGLSHRSRGGDALCSAALIALAATRASFLFCPLALGTVLFLRGQKRRGITVALSSYLVLGVGFLAFQVVCRGMVPYYLVSAHYEILGTYYVDPLGAKFSALWAGVRGQCLPLLLLPVALYVARRVAFSEMELQCLAIFLPTTLVHILAPYFHPVYQAAVLPALLLFLALRLAPAVQGSGARWGWLFLLALALQPVQYGLIYLDTDSRNLFARRHGEVNREIAEQVGEGATVVSFDPGVALLKDLKLIHGLEFGAFSLRQDSRKYPEEYCRARNLINGEMFFRRLQEPDVRALFLPAGIDLGVWGLSQTFLPFQRYSQFGQGGVETVLYLRAPSK